MQILIVDQCCSAKKTSQRTEPLTKDVIDSQPREHLLEKEGVESYRAEDLYQGRQQTRIGDAIKTLEAAGDDVRRVFISAGFGVVDAKDELPSYDITFADMNAEQIDSRANRLDIHDDLHEVIDEQDYDMVYFALGTDYYRSVRLEDLVPSIPDETFVVLFNQEEYENRNRNILSIPARTAEASELGTIVIALKGDYLSNFAAHRASGQSIESLEDIQRFCQSEPCSQSGLDEY